MRKLVSAKHLVAATVAAEIAFVGYLVSGPPPRREAVIVPVQEEPIRLAVEPTVGYALDSSPELQLVGVRVAREPERSGAVIATAGRQRAYRVGDEVAGARLVAMTPTSVRLEANDAARDVRLEDAWR